MDQQSARNKAYRRYMKVWVGWVAKRKDGCFFARRSDSFSSKCDK